MAFHKLQGVDGFIVSDFAGTPRGGVLRVGPKILQSSSDTLARWATYTFATAGIEWSGAAVGVNADGDGQEAALAAALDELTSAEHPPLLLPWLPAVNRYPTLCPVAPEDVAAATTASVVAAAAWALG
ncbi:MAG: hypothetical protein OER95_17605, partial [Acidimicrobiia bacterium]|nr:hypothetical protein [Acidimicrobiia bacterium]